MFSINLHKNIFLFPLKNAGCLLCILSKRLPSFFFFFFISFQSCALLPFIFWNILFSHLWMPSVSTNELWDSQENWKFSHRRKIFFSGVQTDDESPTLDIGTMGYHDHLLIYSSIVQHWSPGRDSNLILGDAYLGPKFT